MIEREHHYQVNVKWTGNKGNGTQSYKDYERSYEISGGGKPVILGVIRPRISGRCQMLESGGPARCCCFSMP